MPYTNEQTLNSAQQRRAQVMARFRQVNQRQAEQPVTPHPRTLVTRSSDGGQRQNGRLQQNRQRNPNRSRISQVQRHDDLAEGNLRNLFGRDGLMTPCGDNDYMSLSYAGMQPFADALTWVPSNTYDLIDKYILWTAPEELTGETPTPRQYIVTSPCAPRPEVAWGAAEYRIRGFTYLGRSSQTNDIYDSEIPCENTEVFRLDGSLIDDNYEWSAYQATGGVINDFDYWSMLGDSSSGPKETAGLLEIMAVGKTDIAGNPLPWLDPTNINWNGGGANAPAGAEWIDGRSYNYGTGLYDAPIPITAGVHIMTVLRSIFYHNMIRIDQSPELKSQRGAISDESVMIVGTLTMIQQLLDYAACYRLCGASGGVDINILYSEKGQNYRQSLLGGRYGYGALEIEGVGFRVPLVPVPSYFDDGLPAGQGRLGVIWKQIGGRRTFYGQFQDMNDISLQGRMRRNGSIGDVFGATDGGLFMHYETWDNSCYKYTVDMHPRFIDDASYLLTLIEGVSYDQPGGVFDVIPTAPGYFGGTRLTPATKS